MLVAQSDFRPEQPPAMLLEKTLRMGRYLAGQFVVHLQDSLGTLLRIRSRFPNQLFELALLLDDQVVTRQLLLNKRIDDFGKLILQLNTDILQLLEQLLQLRVELFGLQFRMLLLVNLQDSVSEIPQGLVQITVLKRQAQQRLLFGMNVQRSIRQNAAQLLQKLHPLGLETLQLRSQLRRTVRRAGRDLEAQRVESRRQLTMFGGLRNTAPGIFRKQPLADQALEILHVFDMSAVGPEGLLGKGCQDLTLAIGPTTLHIIPDHLPLGIRQVTGGVLQKHRMTCKDPLQVLRLGEQTFGVATDSDAVKYIVFPMPGIPVDLRPLVKDFPAAIDSLAHGQPFAQDLMRSPDRMVSPQTRNLDGLVSEAGAQALAPTRKREILVHSEAIQF